MATSLDPPGGQAQLLGPVQRDRTVTGHDNESAAADMAPDEIGQHCLRRHIEHRSRLIEQPDRPLDRDQTGNRETAPLSSRKIDRRQVSEAIEANGGKGVTALRRVSTEKSCPEAEILPQR